MAYRTAQGDMWDTVAFKNYGNEKLFPLLMSANPDYIDVVIFEAGITLSIPELPEEVAAELPPWKRGAGG